MRESYQANYLGSKNLPVYFGMLNYHFPHLGGTDQWHSKTQPAEELTEKQWAAQRYEQLSESNIEMHKL